MTRQQQNQRDNLDHSRAEDQRAAEARALAHDQGITVAAAAQRLRDHARDERQKLDEDELPNGDVDDETTDDGST